MRRTVFAVTLIGLVVLGYLAWPVYSVGRLVRAIEARDVTTAMTYIDVPAVRRSVAEQVMETYLKISGKGPASPLLQGVVAGTTASLADSILAGMFDPETLAEFLRTGWPTGVLNSPPPGVSGLTSANLGSAWQIYSTAKYRLRRFEISVPPSSPAERRFGLEFRLIQWRWYLVNVRLPQDLRLRLAQALAKAQPGR